MARRPHYKHLLLEDIGLSKRLRSILHSQKIMTVGDLRHTPRWGLREYYGLSESDADAVFDAVEKAISDDGRAIIEKLAKTGKFEQRRRVEEELRIINAVDAAWERNLA